VKCLIFTGQDRTERPLSSCDTVTAANHASPLFLSLNTQQYLARKACRYNSYIRH
jgi:hypothetical protein